MGRPPSRPLSAEGGTFALLNLPVGAYRVRVFSATNVLMATQDDVQVVEETELSLIIDPSGRVYESQEGTLVDGAQVFIYRDEDTNNDPYDEASRRLRTLVPLEDLEAESMQGQRTAHGGVYRFAVRRAGRYLMEVVPPGLSQISPSLLVPPVPGYAFTDDPDRNVVPDAVPVVAPGADRTYFLAFELNGIEDEFFHNHVPIDALSSLIDLQKRSRRVEVTRGQVVTYEIDIINRSPRDLITGSETGPAVLQDVLPKGFKYVAGSGTWTRVQSGKEIPLATFDPAEARILRFPVEINAGEALRLRYQAALGANVKARAVYTNRAQLLLAGGNVPISRVATADVRVVPDADFDQGALIGKVFCDTDADGQQSEGEGRPGGGAPLPRHRLVRRDRLGRPVPLPGPRSRKPRREGGRGHPAAGRHLHHRCAAGHPLHARPAGQGQLRGDLPHRRGEWGAHRGGRRGGGGGPGGPARSAGGGERGREEAHGAGARCAAQGLRKHW
jgi:uncharacterized repeat protein (TIGR01451 family)